MTRTRGRSLRRAAPAALLAALLALSAGCGNADGAGGGAAGDEDGGAGSGPDAGGSESPESDAAGACETVDTAGGVVTEADVDGDGRADAVLQPVGADCSVVLVETADGEVLSSGELDSLTVSEAYVAELGNGTRVLVTRQDHARGGYQTRLFAVPEQGERLTELVDADGSPVTPFVATDTEPTTTQAQVNCEDTGVEVVVSQVTGDNAGGLRVFQYRVTSEGASDQQESRPYDLAYRFTDDEPLADCRVD